MNSSGFDIDTDRIARAALSMVFEPGNQAVAKLVDDLGATSVVEALTGGHGRGLLGEVGEAAAARLATSDPGLELWNAAGNGIRFLTPLDPEWPRGLRALGTAEPIGGLSGSALGLWVKGNLDLRALTEESLTVTGARSATSYGEHVASDLSYDLASRGTTIVSGASFGIDQAAHRGALRGDGQTLAVLACGIDRAYPVAHSRLLAEVAERGAVISELAPGAAPTRQRLLARNRITAALTEGTLVVEAAHRGGAIGTAHWAEQLNRAVFAVPGPIVNAQSAGTNELIRTGAAALVTSGMEVTESLELARERSHASAGESFTPTAQRQPNRTAKPVGVPHTSGVTR